MLPSICEFVSQVSPNLFTSISSCSLVSISLFAGNSQFVHWCPSVCLLVSYNLSMACILSCIYLTLVALISFTGVLNLLMGIPDFVHQHPSIFSLVSLNLFASIPQFVQWYPSIFHWCLWICTFIFWEKNEWTNWKILVI